MNKLLSSIIVVMICLGLAGCDTKQNWWDSGISSPYHDCSIMDYLRSDTANWGLTVVLIERAGLTPLFEGKDENYPEITFFAPPSFSILRHVWDEASGKDTGNQRPLTEEEKNHPERLVQALDPDWCREMVMRHVVKGKFLKADRTSLTGTRVMIFLPRNRRAARISPARQGTGCGLSGINRLTGEFRMLVRRRFTFILSTPCKWYPWPLPISSR